MNIEWINFPNGARLVFNSMPDMSSVSIGIWVKTGSRYESEDINGISHFLEHLLFKGTKTRSALQISQEIEGVGGALNGFTSEEYTCYYVKILKHHLHRAVDILFDMVLNPLLRPRDIEKEKGIIIEELNMYLDIPSHYVDDMLSEIMWTGHPLGRRILGSPETILSFNKKKIMKYVQKTYTSNNIVIAVAGHSSLERLRAMIEPHVGIMNREKNISFKGFQNSQKEPCIKLEKKNTEQTHLAIGFKAYSRLNPNRYKAKLLSIILGGNMSSRLFQKIREKHSLAYAIHSSLNQYVDTGSFEIQTGIKNEATSEAVRLIMKEVKKIKTQAVDKRELTMAKEYLIGQIMLSLENTKNSMIQLGENLLTLDRVIPLKETLGEIKKVSREDILRTANEIFMPQNVNLALMGNAPEDNFVKDILKSI